MTLDEFKIKLDILNLSKCSFMIFSKEKYNLKILVDKYHKYNFKLNGYTILPITLIFDILSDVLKIFESDNNSIEIFESSRYPTQYKVKTNKIENKTITVNETFYSIILHKKDSELQYSIGNILTNNYINQINPELVFYDYK